MATPALEFLRFTTHASLSTRLVLSTLTGKPLHISQIRSSSPTNPGLAPHEISFLRLLDSITNGSITQISYTGTTLTYIPGLITGSPATGTPVKCVLPATCARGVSWFLIPLCMLAPFSKAPLNVRFEGPGVITSATVTGDVCIDTVRTAILPLYEAFGILSSKLELRVLSRSCAGPYGVGGGGVVELRFGSQVRVPKTLHLYRGTGRIRRVRGVAYATGVSASTGARMIHAARGVLNPLVKDIHIAAQYDQAPLIPDPSSSSGSAKKRTGVGFGICLLAESSSDHVFYSADVPSPSTGGVTPEDVGKQCAYQLLEIISQGGCVSTVAAPTVLVLMAMGSEDVGRVRLGREVLGQEEVITLARDIRAFGGSAWGLRDVESERGDGSEETDIVVSVKGSGWGNVGKKIA